MMYQEAIRCPRGPSGKRHHVLWEKSSEEGVPSVSRDPEQGSGDTADTLPLGLCALIHGTAAAAPLRGLPSTYSWGADSASA